jgi:hypothetical protein
MDKFTLRYRNKGNIAGADSLFFCNWLLYFYYTSRRSDEAQPAY